MLSVRDVIPSDRDSYIAVKREQYAEEFLKLCGDDNSLFSGLWEDSCGENNRLYAIEKEDGETVGFGLLQELNSGKPSIGIDIFEKHGGNGFATEGVRLMLQQYHEETGVSVFSWRAFVSNIASNRVAEKLGGELVGVEQLQVGHEITDKLEEKGVDLAEILPKVNTYQIRL